MKAVVIRAYGTPDVLGVEEVPTPTPGPGQVLVRVEAVSVNYADIVRRRNDPYPVPTPLPAILGGEVAGYIDALERLGAVRRFAGRIEPFAYAPIDSSLTIAQEIARRFAASKANPSSAAA